MSQLIKNRASEILRSLRERKVLVLGDVMLDEFVWGDVTRISPEGPVPVVDVRRESVHLGGAANVLANLISLGAHGRVVGVVGNDYAGQRLREELRHLNSSGDIGVIVDESRRSTTKTRIVAHSQLVVRADRESRAPVSPQVEGQIIDRLKEGLAEAHAFVVSDYDKGVVTPNHLEALRMSDTEDHSDDGSREAGRIIQQKLGCDAVLITRGDRGMMLLEVGAEPVYVKTAAREVYDVTGAGDTVIATLAAALASGATMVEAASLANHAAGIVVGKVGTATATADELLDTFD